MRRVIRWVDPEGYVSVGVEHPRDGEFSLLRGLEDPTRLLQGESFPLGPRVMPIDAFSLELEPGLTLISPIDPPEVWCADGTYDTGDAEPMEALVRDKMGHAVDLSVPLEVSVGTGRSWHEAAH